MNTRESRLTGSAPFPKMNVTRYNINYDRDCGRSRDHRHSHGRRKINFCNYNGYNSNKSSQNKEKKKGRIYIIKIPKR